MKAINKQKEKGELIKPYWAVAQEVRRDKQHKYLHPHIYETLRL